MEKRRGGLWQSLNLSLQLLNIHGRPLFERQLEIGRPLREVGGLLRLSRSLAFFRLNNMLRSRVVDLKPVRCFFDCLLLDVYHVDKLLSCRWIYSLVAPLSRL
jgi:hypothetical protein